MGIEVRARAAVSWLTSRGRPASRSRCQIVGRRRRTRGRLLSCSSVTASSSKFPCRRRGSGRLVEARRGVAHELGASQLEDVPVAVDAYVIGDVDPPLRVLVVLLVLAEASGRAAVVAEDRGRVDCHAAERERAAGREDGVPLASRHNRTLNRRSPWGRSKSWAQVAGSPSGWSRGRPLQRGLGMGDELGTARAPSSRR